MPKFTIYKDKAGYYRWWLKATNGEKVAASEAYVSFDGAKKSIEMIKRLAPIALF